MREVWEGVRGTVFVAAQVLTLGALALVLGLLALNAAFKHPTVAPTAVPGPARPLALAQATFEPTVTIAAPAFATPTGVIEATETPAPLVDALGTAAAGSPGWTPPAVVLTTTAIAASQPTATPDSPPTEAPPPTQPPPTAVPQAAPPAPTSTPLPPRPNAAAEPSATSVVAGQLMKIVPTDDGLPARMRAEPKTDAEILIRVPLGTQVEALGTASGDEVRPGNDRWVRIRWRGIIGYVYSELIGN